MKEDLEDNVYTATDQWGCQLPNLFIFAFLSSFMVWCVYQWSEDYHWRLRCQNTIVLHFSVSLTIIRCSIQRCQLMVFPYCAVKDRWANCVCACVRARTQLNSPGNRFLEQQFKSCSVTGIELSSLFSHTVSCVKSLASTIFIQWSTQSLYCCWS